MKNMFFFENSVMSFSDWSRIITVYLTNFEAESGAIFGL